MCHDALTLDSEGVTGVGPGRDFHQNQASDRRHMHLRAEYRLIEGYREFDQNIPPLAAERSV